MAGIRNANSAILAVKLMNQKLLFASYAKEGLVNQHTANKAINMVINKIQKND